MFLVITLSAILGLIGTDIFVPSLPHIANLFNQTPNQAQLTISLFLAGFAVSQLFYGPISDRFGRKIPLMTGVSIFIVGSLICVFADTFTLLCLGRIIQGLGVGAGLSLSRVILRDCYTGTELAIKTARIAIFVSLTPALAPFLGGILQQHFGFSASFIFMLGYGILLLFLILTRFKETIREKSLELSFSSTLNSYLGLIRNLGFIRYAIIAGLAFSSIIIYANVVPFIAQNQFNLSPVGSGALLLVSALGICLGSLISSKIVTRLGPAYLINLGLIIYMSNGLFLLASHYIFPHSLLLLILPLILITMACGFIFPNAIALCFSGIKTSIGTAGSIYGAMQTFISMLFNFALNLISQQNQTLLGILYFLIGLMGVMILLGTKDYSLTNNLNKYDTASK